jgi:hypothetical protein
MEKLIPLLFLCSCSLNSSPVVETTEVGSAIQPLLGIDSLTQPPIDWTAYDIQLEPDTISYNQAKTKVAAHRSALRAQWNAGTIDLDSVGQVFTDLLVNQIMPYWYGTPWDFEGHTDVPNEGMIACGYLVSTTLQHLGLNLNRYRLAQQAALNEAKTLALDEPIVSMIRLSLPEVIDQIKELDEGLYIIGLDYHVGLILHQKGEVFFIHSSIFEPVSVVIEPAETSLAMLYNDDYYLAPLSTNQKLMEAWLKGTRIEVVR